MKLRYLTPLLLCASLWAAPAITHRYNVTSAPVTLTALGTAHTVVAAIDASVVPASVHVTGGTGGSQALTQWGSALINSSSHVSWWVLNTSGASAGETSLTCTTCGTVNAVHAWEISGTNTTNPVDKLVICTSPGFCNQPSNVLTFNPGFSAEAILYAGNCSGSASSVTATGVTLTTAFPNGEPGGDGITSAAGTITISPDSGCGGVGNTILGVQGAEATQACTWDASYFDYSAAGNSTAHPTISATSTQAGDLIAIAAWCISGCSTGTMAVGSDSATFAAQTGVSNASTGQPFIAYDVTSAAGPQTITWTPTGTWTQDQIAYYDFVPSQGCTISHDVDATPAICTSSCSSPITSPSITPTQGDLLFNFTPVFSHATGVGGSWVCNDYTQAGETASCFFVTTVNVSPYILSAPSGSTANNVTQLVSTAAWQGIISAFKLTGSGGSATIAQPFVIHP